MKYVARVTPKHYQNVYQMMQQQNFPDTPASLNQASLFFERSILLGVWDEGVMIATVLLFATDKQTYCIDGVCLPEKQGKWATAKVVRDMLFYIFETLSCEVLWTESKRIKAQNLTTSLGFQKVCQTSNGTLSVLTAPLAHKFMRQK